MPVVATVVTILCPSGDGGVTDRGQPRLVALGLPSEPPPPAAPPVLQRGAEGIAVADLQARLEKLRFWVGPADGVFRRLTEQAVYAFQKANGLGADDTVGPLTRAALREPAVLVPHTTEGSAIEIDKARQLLYAVEDGSLRWVFNTSTGTEEPYRHVGRRSDADGVTRRRLRGITASGPGGVTACPPAITAECTQSQGVTRV